MDKSNIEVEEEIENGKVGDDARMPLSFLP